MGVAEVRLYQNTENVIPAAFNDISSLFPSGGQIDETLSDTFTVGGLATGTEYYFWCEALDDAGNSSGPVSLGSKYTEGIPQSAIVTASSTNKGVGPSGAFDSFVGTQFGASPGHCWVPDNTQPQWMQIQYPSAVTAEKYRLWACPSSTYPDCPGSWTFEGSQDGSTWTVLDTQTSNPPPFFNGATDQEYTVPYGEYTIASPAPYVYYKLNVTAGAGPIRTNWTNISLLKILLV